MPFRVFSSLASMPADATRWWAATADNMFITPWWVETMIEAGLDTGATVAIGLLESDEGAPLAILPCLIASRRTGQQSRSTLRSMTGIYSCAFRPVLARTPSPAPLAHALGRSIGATLTARDIIHFDALDADWPELASFKAGLADSGFRTADYPHFGNWHEPVASLTFTDYLAARRGSLREILRRKRRAADRKGASFMIVRDGDALPVAWQAYDDVYGRSWKPAEPYPRFQLDLANRAVHQGALRLGIMRLGAVPVAIQFWIVWRGTATVLKLAHDEKFADLSPGTLLTAYMIENLMNEGSVTALDFGRGDDPYKQLWTSKRRQRIGLFGANPRSPEGAMILMRQHAGNWLRSMSRRSAAF